MFLTNALHVARQLMTKCDGQHSHQHLIGGRAAAVARYPQELCEAIVRGIIDQQNADKGKTTIAGVMRVGSLSQSQKLQVRIDADRLHEEAGVPAAIKVEDNELIKWQMENCDNIQAWDDVSGTELEARKVLEARLVELRFVF